MRDYLSGRKWHSESNSKYDFCFYWFFESNKG
jgi:hypothetical protein